MVSMPDAYWLGMLRVRGVGPRIARLLLERFHSPERVFKAEEAELIAAGIPGPTARNLKQFAEFAPLERELCELARIGARLVRWSDSDYPENLRNIHDPPPYFCMRGTLIPGNARLIAVVGARTASDAGRRMAHRLGLELAGKGFTVVSGLARGIDCEAHQGALDGGGSTIAVLGCGIDIVYPPENKKVAEAIVMSNGALISELPLGAPPIAENFPSRNRLISGLSLGVIVVEAAERSGSLITARMALEQDRQVFAVPGSPVSGKTRGSNRLLKQGARLVECVEDVLEELMPQLQAGGQNSPRQENTSAPQPNRAAALADSDAGEANAILQLLTSADKLHVDSLIDGSGMTASAVLKLLLELELRGVVTQHPGKLFSLANG